MSSKKVTLFLIGIITLVNSLFFIREFNTSEQQFVWQADGFLEGQLNVIPFESLDPAWDMVVVGGKLYWPQGPFPAIVIMPFRKLFGGIVNQGIIQAVLLVLTSVIAYSLARKHSYSKEDSILLTGVFLFGSVFSRLFSSPGSWYFSQVVAVSFSLLAIFLWYKKSPPLIIGLICGCIFSTRPIASLFIFLFLWEIVVSNQITRVKITKSILLLLPIILVLFLLGLYNWARFGNLFDNGYLINNIGTMSSVYRNMGLFSLRHIPRNFFWYFLSVPAMIHDGPSLSFPFLKASEFGMSFFLVSPFFVYSIRTIKKKQYLGYWVVIGISLFSLLSYFNTGWHTYGPRYMADLLPLLYIVLIKSFSGSKLTTKQKFIALLSMLFNTYMIFGTEVYPLLIH